MLRLLRFYWCSSNQSTSTTRVEMSHVKGMTIMMFKLHRESRGKSASGSKNFCSTTGKSSSWKSYRIERHVIHFLPHNITVSHKQLSCSQHEVYIHYHSSTSLLDSRNGNETCIDLNRESETRLRSRTTPLESSVPTHCFWMKGVKVVSRFFAGFPSKWWWRTHHVLHVKQQL
jgi:hypothetical protein